MRKFILLMVAVFLLAVSLVFAQNTGFKRLQNPESNNEERIIIPVPPVRIVPQIIVASNLEPITLQDLKVDVEVIGNLAIATYDMTFFNPNSRVLEGEFVFPLGENQNVSAIALDINGKMREGVVVEKQKARETFEAIVRRGVDPALVEKTSGNQFKTRIYPFNPNNTRRIRVTVEEPLTVQNNKYICNIPLTFDRQLKNFAVNVEIPAGKERPVVDTDISGFAFNKVSNVLKAEFSAKNYLLNNKLAFGVPREKDAPVFTHKDGNNTYFYSDINIKASQKDKVMPKKIALVWDMSLSSGKRDTEREIALLDEYFKKVSDVEVSFMTFNIVAGDVHKFHVKKGNWEELKEKIVTVTYDGATRFDGLDLNSLKVDEVLLFTDGVSTFGNTKIAEAGSPVFVINSSSEFNRGNLINAARQSGGSFINLNAVSGEKALDMLTKQNLKLVDISYDKNKFKEVYPLAGTDAGENLTFAGILTAASGEISLSFGYNKKDITETKKIKITAGGDNSAVARLWAQQKIFDLEMDSEKNEKEILKLGQEYSIVTEFTSLLVLEEVRDYVTYKITPPQELLAEYNRIVGSMRKQEEATEKSALDDSIRQAQEMKDWWNKDFDQTKPARKYEKLKSGNIEIAETSDNASFADEEIIEREVAFAKAVVPAAAMRAEEASVQETRVLSERRARSTARNDMVAQEAMALDTIAGSVADVDMNLEEKSSSASVSVKAWDPQTPYMKILKKSADKELYNDYLKLKIGYSDQPSFYFDVTDEFVRRKQYDKALIVLSNVAEMQIDNPELLRVAANKLMEMNEYQYAVDIFEKVLKLRGEDPQSYRDLALAYQANGEAQKALEYFYKVLAKSWGRFNTVKQIVFVEMNNLISLNPKLDLGGIDKELIFAMPVDIRIVLGWSSDNTDIDIHVTDPYGEKAYYGNRLTKIGGKVSYDLRNGFGPEEYMLKKAVDGEYEVSTNNFSDSRQSISGPTVLYLDIYTFYGTKKQTRERVLVRTENVKQNNSIGTVKFKK